MEYVFSFRNNVDWQRVQHRVSRGSVTRRTGRRTEITQRPDCTWSPRDFLAIVGVDHSAGITRSYDRPTDLTGTLLHRMLPRVFHTASSLVSPITTTASRRAFSRSAMVSAPLYHSFRCLALTTAVGQYNLNSFVRPLHRSHLPMKPLLSLQFEQQLARTKVSTELNAFQAAI